MAVVMIKSLKQLSFVWAVTRKISYIIFSGAPFEFGNELSILADIQNRSDSEIFDILLKIEPRTITSSKLYQVQPDIFKSVVVKSLRYIDTLVKDEVISQEDLDKECLGIKYSEGGYFEVGYSEGETRSWIGLFFGSFKDVGRKPFEHFIFIPPDAYKEMEESPICYYTYENYWIPHRFIPNTVYKTVKDSGRSVSKLSLSTSRFKPVLSTIDSLARTELNFKYKTTPKVLEFWIINAVQNAFKEINEEKEQD